MLENIFFDVIDVRVGEAEPKPLEHPQHSTPAASVRLVKWVHRSRSFRGQTNTSPSKLAIALG
ncbi:MAG: hypothetical protein AAF805_00940 [Planctomycetota bacterium]